MQITAHHPSDMTTLKHLFQQASNAKQRDRYRAVLLALEGHTTPQIRILAGSQQELCSAMELCVP